MALESGGWRCAACGRAGRLEVDHIEPLHRGGDVWDAANLQVLCGGCHIKKTASENRRALTPSEQAWLDLVAGMFPGDVP